MTHHHAALVIGAGPAGLTAAYELVRRGIRPLVVDQADKVGGIARTESYKGYRFDIGGHRFYTKVTEIQRLWEEMMGADFLRVSRLSRIHYHGHFYHYPLQVRNTLRNLGLVESALILLSYARAKLRPTREETNFEQWVTNRFGRRLYRTFFKTYTEKVWGIPCDRIQAEWAAQRIHGLSLRTAVLHAVLGGNQAKSLIHEFLYPVLGPGMMWQRFEEWVEKRGGRVALQTEVLELRHDGRRITSALTRSGTREEEIAADHVISSMPIDTLVHRLRPAPPSDVIAAARGLRHRAFLIVCLILDRDQLFPDNWLYIHSPEVRVGRIQNFKNWSAAMVPDEGRSCLGMEYFCSEGDATWNLSDEALLDLARRELEQLGLASAADVWDGTVVRQPKAYPVYDEEYRAHLAVLRRHLDALENLQTVGRNGMHRYNNQDHSMLTGLLAARNICGERHDLWNVNTERSYYEVIEVDPRGKGEPVRPPLRVPRD